jgi:hypothetical protein
MLDLPVESTTSFDNRIWEADTDRIPPVDSKVTVILQPISEGEKGK